MKLKEILKAKELRSSYKEEKISEEEIKHLVRYEILECRTEVASHDDLCFTLITLTKCNTTHARNVINKMQELGIDLCRDKISLDSYNLVRFAVLRKYVTVDEIVTFAREKWRTQEEIDLQKTTEKYGSDKSKWPKEELDKYNEWLKK